MALSRGRQHDVAVSGLCKECTHDGLAAVSASNKELEMFKNAKGGGTNHRADQRICRTKSRRVAAAYVRTAVADRAAAKSQRMALVHRLVALGWPVTRIKVISDIGASGLSAHHRGFQRLLRWIDRDEVGLVAATDVARISRDPLVFQAFMKALHRRGVPLLLYDASRT